MKGIQRESELHAPARALYVDQKYDREEWRSLYLSIGDKIARRRWLGDRLLDLLEARNLRGQTGVPPGLLDLINKYRELCDLHPVAIRNTYQAHIIVLRVQSTLLKPDVIRELLQKKEDTW